METMIAGYRGVRDFLADKLGNTIKPTDATIRRWVSKGLFPAPRRLGEQSLMWIEREVLNHLANLPLGEDQPLKQCKPKAKRDQR